MRYLLIPMIMTALMLGGCYSPASDKWSDSFVKDYYIKSAVGVEKPTDLIGVAGGVVILGTAALGKSIYRSIVPEAPPYGGISDAEFCKRYSPVNKLVALEMARRKMDASKC